MGFSKFLDSRREAAKELVKHLGQYFSYVSILGSDVKTKGIRADRNSSGISNGRDTECGFVVKMSRGSIFFEYAMNDISGDMAELAKTLSEAFQLNESLLSNTIDPVTLSDEPLVQDFQRPDDLAEFTNDQLLTFCKEQSAALLNKNEHVRNATCAISTLDVSKLFITANRELSQHYVWVNGYLVVVYNENDKTVYSREGANSHLMGNVLADLPGKADQLLHKLHMLTLAKPIEPGVYDVITDPSITGLIAHEAFGHGVEMDQFVKDRALAKEYVGKYVASPICNMRDGAASTLSAASYFFDDEGVLAHDTQIIKDGILVTGISDLASATQLGTAPTGNGRRESFSHKAYSRMTNTFFEKGTDKLEDMIASIDHGYMIFETNNGMEDPKNWAIQCVAEYGIEIKDGKLTDNWVSPVVMSGYVPDLLKSMSMVSDDFKIEGSGSCGKGYKEWVRVSDGGPALKVKVKLG